jgi:hypothetical protein
MRDNNVVEWIIPFAEAGETYPDDHCKVVELVRRIRRCSLVKLRRTSVEKLSSTPEAQFDASCISSCELDLTS